MWQCQLAIFNFSRAIFYYFVHTFRKRTNESCMKFAPLRSTTDFSHTFPVIKLLPIIMFPQILAVLFLASCSCAVDISKSYVPTNELSQVQGTIEPVDCRSQGEISRVTFTNCSSFPCDIVRSKTYNIEITLNPAQDHNSLELQISSILFGTETPLYNADIAVAVSQGKSVTLAYPWTVYGNVVPFQNAGVRVKLGADGVTEFCGIIPANVW